MSEPGSERRAEVRAGSVLGDRFELHGVVGQGGQATVYLATDRVRDERIALKVVHPHLAADPSVRRRFQREVRTASMVATDAALVPYDLHELEGTLALSMPFHHGQTLAERVASRGPLPAEGVRALGIRVATALADAHRVGVLHRDVSATNVLVGERPEDTVLTDFGLARLQGGGRSTGVLGTAGYAAPEVYAGERADPRSDLYGLGAVMYLAATGRPAFDPREPMAALKQQVEGTFTPVRDLAPEVPADLAATIEALLRPDPAARPQGARDVVDALERREGQAPPPTPAVPRLPAGRSTVVVRERPDDRVRRQGLRADRGTVPRTAELELARWGRHLVGKVRDALGIPASDGPTPEELLRRVVAGELGVAAESLPQPPALLEHTFRLVDATDDATARRLADGARTAGFDAGVQRVGRLTAVEQLLSLAWVGIPLLWIVGAPLLESVGMWLLPVLVLATVLLATVSGSTRGRSRAQRHPVAFEVGGIVGAPAPAAATATAAPAAAPATRSQSLLGRATAALDALDAALTANADLPEPARADLRGTVRGLRDHAAALAAEVETLEQVLPGSGASEVEVTALRSRLARMVTLAGAGEVVDEAERERLQRAVDRHEADLQAAERVEGRLAACTAQLLEIASTASRVRRDLLSEPHPARSADALVERLQRESRAVDDARRETAARAHRARGARQS